MKKTVLILLVLAGIGSYVGPLLFGQQPQPINRTPKVAIVNVRAVLKENPKARALQTELEDALKPHKAKAETLSKEIDALAKFPNAPTLAAKKSEWEAVNGTIMELIEAKHKDKLPAVWNDVNEAIEAVAARYGFQIVLGHSDPDDPDLQKFQGAKASKLRVTDSGGTVAAYVHGSVDITNIVTQTLKSR